MRSERFLAARLLALLIPLALVGGALIGQFGFGLYPCELCHWQRWPHYAAIALAVLAFLIPGRVERRWLVALAAVGIAVSGLIGVYHAGIEYHWWQGATACTSTVSSAGSADEMLARILNAPLIRCDVAQWTLFGISLAGYNAIVSLMGAAAIAGLLFGRRQSA